MKIYYNAEGGGNGGGGGPTAGGGTAAATGAGAAPGAGAGAAAAGAAAGAGGAGGGGGAFSFDALPFSDASKAVVSSKGFKDLDSIVQWGANAEKYMGTPAEQLLKLPKSMDDATAMKEVWQRLGAGKTADDYKLEVPAGKDGKPGDDSFAKVAAKWFHEHDIPVPKAQGLAKAWNKHAADAVAAQEAAQSQKFALEHTALKTEWGSQFAGNEMIAKRGMAAIGISGEMIDAIEAKLGFAATMKWALGVGSKIGGNGDFVTSDLPADFGGVSPAQAAQKISEMKSDKELMKRYFAGDVKVVQDMTRLHNIAFPEQARR